MLRLLSNPWILLCGLVLVIGLIVGAYIKGGRDAVNAEAARAARDKQLASLVYENAQRATAGQLAALKIENKTIRQTLEKEIIRDPIFTACELPDGTYRLLNRHLSGPPGESTGDRELPPNPRPAGR